MSDKLMLKFIETKSGNTIHWMIYSEGIKNRIAELEVFIDSEGKIWLNQIYVEDEFRPNGGAAKIFQEALKKHGKILISIADKGSHKRNGIIDDTRYIEPPDGVRFINNLFKYNILTKEDFKTPFPKEIIWSAKEYFPFLF